MIDITNFIQLLGLLPLAIVGITVVLLLVAISLKRNHLFSCLLTVSGLLISLLSLFLINTKNPHTVAFLMQIDRHAVFYVALMLLSSIVTCIFSYSWLEQNAVQKDEFYLLILIATLGGIVTAYVNHLTALFIGVELVSLPLFGLIGFNFQKNSSLEASIKYTILSATSSSFLLFGIALLYAKIGDLSFTVLNAAFINDIGYHQPLIIVGLTFVILSMLFKLSLMPLHFWTPDVYQGSPIPTVLFLSTFSKLAAFTALLRLSLYIPFLSNQTTQGIFTAISVISIIFGSLMALHQSDIKRLLGYLSIVQSGYLLTCITTIQISSISLEVIAIYLISYLLATFGIFSMLSTYCTKLDNSDYTFASSHMQKTSKMLTVKMTIFVLSIIGIPTTLGFVSKLYLLSMTINCRFWILVIAIVTGSLISLFYYLRLMNGVYVKKIFSEENFDTGMIYHRTSKVETAVSFLSVTFILLLGIFPQIIIRLLKFIL